MLEFDEAAHEYSDELGRIPGVSEILTSVGISDFAGIPQETLERAQLRGRAVHLACHFHDTGVLKRESVDPQIEGYFQSYLEFLRASGVKILLSEEKFKSKTWRFAGTVDRVITLNGVIGIADLKTGATSRRATEIQTAAYHMLVCENRPDVKPTKRFEIKLFEDGRMAELIPFNNLEKDINIFLCANTVHAWKLNGGKNHAH